MKPSEMTTVELLKLAGASVGATGAPPEFYAELCAAVHERANRLQAALNRARSDCALRDSPDGWTIQKRVLKEETLLEINGRSALGQGQGKAQISESPATGMEPGQRCTRGRIDVDDYHEVHEFKPDEEKLWVDHFDPVQRCPYVHPTRPPGGREP